jgi:hypothetical protein
MQWRGKGPLPDGAGVHLPGAEKGGRGIDAGSGKGVRGLLSP